MILIDLIEFQNRRLATAVMRCRMESLVRAALREGAARRVTTGLEGKHAGHVRLECQHLNIEHELHVLRERIGNARRRLGQQPLLTTLVLRFHLLNATLELAHIFEILLHALTIGRAQVALERRHLAHHPIKDAAIVAAARRSVGIAAAGAKQQVKRGPWIADHRQRLRRRRPADRVGVRAGVVVRATAGLIQIFDAQLHRRNRRVLSDFARHDLIKRVADKQVGSLRLLGMRLREEHRTRPEVIAADFRRLERLRHAHIGVADDVDVLAPRIERLERALGAERKFTSQSLRCPQVLRGTPGVGARRAVHRLDTHESRALGRFAGATHLGDETPSRFHGVQIGQGNRG